MRRPCADAAKEFTRIIILINCYSSSFLCSFFYDNVFAIGCILIYVETTDWYEFGRECEKITLKLVKNKEGSLQFPGKYWQKVKLRSNMSNSVILSVNKALFLSGNLYLYFCGGVLKWDTCLSPNSCQNKTSVSIII